MFGLVGEILYFLYLAILFIPLVILIIATVSFPIIISTLIIQHKLQRHHH
jgi:hypothetical protein